MAERVERGPEAGVEGLELAVVLRCSPRLPTMELSVRLCTVLEMVLRLRSGSGTASRLLDRVGLNGLEPRPWLEVGMVSEPCIVLVLELELDIVLVSGSVASIMAFEPVLTLALAPWLERVECDGTGFGPKLVAVLLRTVPGLRLLLGRGPGRGPGPGVVMELGWRWI